MTEDKQTTFEFESRPTIKGFPELHWTGKRPYRSTQYFPAQIKERHGSEVNGWINKIFWGDNLQVMSHLLKEYRGKVDLIYIDPPFDSKADYKKEISLKGKKVQSDSSSFEEKQYSDIWTNDEYLQFMYERLILLRELLSDAGSLFLHCDWHKSHQLRCLMDEVFGPQNFVNEIVWCYYGPGSPGMRQFNRKHDTIYWYSKVNNVWKFNAESIRIPHDEKTTENFKDGLKGSGFIAGEYNLADGKIPEDWWELAIAGRYPNDGIKRVKYPTEKPYKLLERIITATTDVGDIVADFFMGSGVTQMCAMKLGRRFLGADINLSSIQTTTKRLLKVANELKPNQKTLDVEDGEDIKYTGFEVYNVNNYDIFRNPEEARELLLEAYQVQKFASSSVYDGELDGWMVKILPADDINRIATKADLEGFVANLPYKTFEMRKADSPNAPVERIRFICMGHEPDLAAAFKAKVPNYKIDVEVVDVMRDRKELHFKHDSDAKIVRDGDNLVIEEFYPLNLMQKLSWMEDDVTDWRQLVESVMIDWNYDGAVMEPKVTDIPEKADLVKGVYPIPEDFGVIKIKITDLLSESYEEELRW